MKSFTVAFSFALASTLVFAAADDANACSCSPRTVADAFADAAVVLRATVVAVHEQDRTACDVDESVEQDGAAPMLIELEVDDVFKGAATERSFVASTSSACPAPLRPGDERILFLQTIGPSELESPLEGALGVDSCSTIITPPAELPPELATRRRARTHGHRSSMRVVHESRSGASSNC